MHCKFILVPFLLIVLVAFQEAASAPMELVVKFNATNAGGIRFEKEIGVDTTVQTFFNATNFIQNTTFQQSSDADKKNISRVTVIINTMDGIAYTLNDEIYISSEYIGGFSGDVKKEIIGVLFHETTHVWQWDGEGQTPGGLIEGIADYVRLKAGYAPSQWVKPGQGDSWDQGYDVTAWFLDYCNDLGNGFVAELNKKMRTGYSADFFVELLGKPIDQLWTEYKAMYNN